LNQYFSDVCLTFSRKYANEIGGYTILYFGAPSKWYMPVLKYRISGFKSGTSIGLPGVSLLGKVTGMLKLIPPARKVEPYRGD